jgi:hypothetical protein
MHAHANECDDMMPFAAMAPAIRPSESDWRRANQIARRESVWKMLTGKGTIDKSHQFERFALCSNCNRFFQTSSNAQNAQIGMKLRL